MTPKFQFSFPTDHAPGGWHEAYVPVYERLLEKYTMDEVNVLEVGTDGGGMTRAYRDFFPIGQVVAVDISPAPESVKVPGITHYQMDAYTPQALDVLRENHRHFDVMVDDGSHFYHHQAFFVQHYSRLLAPGGIMIVEDIADYGYIQNFQNLLPADLQSMCVDLRHTRQKRFDDLLFVALRD